MFRSREKRAFAFYVILFSSVITSLHAQQEETAGSIQAGPGYLFPSLEVEGFYDDNVLRQPDNSVDTFGIRATPGASYKVGDEIRKFVLDWLLEAGWHEATGNDDYIDNSVSATMQYQPLSRISAGLKGTYKDAHDPRGTGRAEATNLILDDPDEWHSFGVESNLAYGARTATGRIEVDLGYTTIDYDNNRAVTFVRDRGDISAAGRFLYRVGSRTSLLLEGRFANYGYDQTPIGVPGLNSNVYRAMTGARWDATDKTSGFVKVGYISKDFKTSMRQDSNAIGWEVGGEWRPRTYSTLSFSTARDFRETNGAGDFIKRDSADVRWKHFWLERFSSLAEVGYAKDTFDPTDRNDDLLNAGFRLEYTMRRWLTIGAGYRYFNRESSDDLFDYEKNLFEMLLKMTL